MEPGQRTDDFAAKRAGLGNRKTAAMAERAVKAGASKLVEAMDQGEVSISAANEIAGCSQAPMSNNVWSCAGQARDTRLG